MIKNLNYTAKNGILIEADVDGIHKQILFSDIEPFWSYANEDDFEGGYANIKDDYIIFTILVASSQGGVIVIWDTKKDCVVHISEGSYCLTASIYKDRVFYLCDVCNYTMPSHYQMYSIPLYTMDSYKEGTRLYNQNPCKITENNIKSIRLKVDEAGISVIVNNNAYCYSDTLDEAVNTVRKEEYSWLYEETDLNIAKVFGWLT